MLAAGHMSNPPDKTRNDRVINPPPPELRWTIVIGAILAGVIGTYGLFRLRPPVAKVQRTHWVYTVAVRQRTLVHHEGFDPPSDALNAQCEQRPRAGGAAAQFCRYEQVEWPVIETLKAEGDGDQVRWPSELARTPDRRLERHEAYEVILRSHGHRSVYAPKDYAEFRRFVKGQSWTFKEHPDGTLTPIAQVK
jgi:hypothetical protein